MEEQSEPTPTTSIPTVTMAPELAEGASFAQATEADLDDFDDDDEYDLETHGGATEDGLPAGRFLDRELSWLAFNQRVLELAEDETVPLLERANFLAIFASNLDEFFMVRVAGLKRRIVTGLAVPTNVGVSPYDHPSPLASKAKAVSYVREPMT